MLVFVGAGPSNCGNFYLESTSDVGVIQPGPSNFIYTAVDGNGTVLRTRSGVANIGGPFVRFGDNNGLGRPFDVKPTRNPIHVTLVMDGVTLASVSANDPCVSS